MAKTDRRTQARPRMVNEFSRIPYLQEPELLLEAPDDLQAAHLADFARAHDDFADTLMQELKNQLIKSSDQRESALGTAGTFSERRKRVKKRMRIQVDPQFTPEGQIDRTKPDGHADVGVTMGWTRENARTAAAQLRQKLFESSQRPFVPEGRGARQENALIERIAGSVVMDQLEKAKYIRAGRHETSKSAADGTAFIRYELVRRTRFTQEMFADLFEQRLFWQENTPEYVPSLRIWPIENVYVTHWDQPEVEDQQGVFWVTPQVDIMTLEKDEVKEDPETGELIHGKYRNLQAVREASEAAQGRKGSRKSTYTQGIFPTATLIEYEGPLPLARWAKELLVDQDIMEFYGVDVGMIPDPSSEEEMLEYGRRLQQIPVWHVAFLTNFSSADRKWNDVSSFSGSILLRCEPDRSREPHNSLFAFQYQPDDLNFLGLSISDLGWRIEDAADGLLNADTWVATKNAHPSGLYSKKKLARKDKTEIVRLLREYDGLVEFGGAEQETINARDVLFLIELPEVKELLSKLNFYKYTFDLATGVKPALKAQDTAPGTGTLGHVQLNLSLAEIDIQDIVLAQAAEWCRLVTTIWKDITWYMPPEEFADYAADVSGLGISEVMQVLPSITGLGDEVRFHHPLAAVADKSVLTTLLLRIRQVFPDADWDPDVMAKRLVEFAGYPRSEELFRKGRVMKPEDEQHQFARGNWIEPSLFEDVIQHIYHHYRRFMVLTEAIGGPEETPTDSMEMELTARHLQETMDMVERFMSMQGPLAGLQNPQGMMGGGQGGALGLKRGNAQTGRAPRMIDGPTQENLGEQPPNVEERRLDLEQEASARVS